MQSIESVDEVQYPQYFPLAGQAAHRSVTSFVGERKYVDVFYLMHGVDRCAPRQVINIGETLIHRSGICWKKNSIACG